MQTVFRFRQFEVWTPEDVFSVTTDSVLLGSWTDCSIAQQVLDIGTGNGILSLMIAQRSSPEATIHAIDRSEASVHCARYNFAKSPWAKKCNAYLMNANDLLTNPNFFQDQSFDLIITNPPYYKNQQKSSAMGMQLARHQDDIDFATLAKTVAIKLADSGKFCCVLPAHLELECSKTMLHSGLYLAKRIQIRHHDQATNSIILLEYHKQSQVTELGNLVLFDGEGHKTEEYKILTDSYYV